MKKLRIKYLEDKRFFNKKRDVFSVPFLLVLNYIQTYFLTLKNDLFFTIKFILRIELKDYRSF